MVKVIKKSNITGKVYFAEDIQFYGESFTLEAQISVVKCHPENSTIRNLPYQFFTERGDFVKVNGENVYYTRDEIENLFSSPEFKNLILKKIVELAFSPLQNGTSTF